MHHGVYGGKRKGLLGREGENRLRPFETERRLAPQLMERRRPVEGESLAKGSGGDPSLGDRFFRVAEGLIGKALLPEDNG